MTLSILRCAVDSAEISFAAGSIPEESLQTLHRKKLIAQDKNEPQPILLAGRTFYLQDKARRRWKFEARSDDMIVWLRDASGSMPSMMVRFLAYGLASRGVQSLWDEARSIASDLGVGHGRLSRVDICKDFQGWEPTFAEMRNITCPSGFRPVYPSADKPETFQIGRGDLVVRLYNKSAEIRAKRKEWWKHVWAICPGYDPDAQVWRAEVQLRGDVLGQIGMKDPEEAFSRLGEIFAFGFEWAELKAPSETDSNLRRAPVDDRWATLRDTDRGDKPLMRVRRIAASMDYDRAVWRIAGYLATCAAIKGTDDLYETTIEVMRELESQLIERDIEWDELVETKNRKRHSS